MGFRQVPDGEAGGYAGVVLVRVVVVVVRHVVVGGAVRLGGLAEVHRGVPEDEEGRENEVLLRPAPSVAVGARQPLEE